jgi:hypothetical protein
MASRPAPRRRPHPAVIELVKLLARLAAEQDHETQQKRDVVK